MSDLTITAPYAAAVAAFKESATVVGKRVCIPALAYVLASPDADGVSFQSTDLEVFATRRVSGSASGGPALLPVAACVDALKGVRGSVTPAKAAAQPVTFTLAGGVLTLAGFGRELRVNTDTPSIGDFPTFPAPAATEAATVTADSFGAAWKFAVTAAGKDLTLPMLTGVCVGSDGTGMTMAATDRYRLTACDVAGATVTDVWTAIVPTALSRLLPGMSGKLTISTDTDGYSAGRPSALEFTHDDGVIRVRTIDATFPTWKALIPDAGDVWCDLDRRRLLDDTAAGAAMLDRAPLRVTFGPSGVTVDGSGTVPAETDATDDVSCGFNPAFLSALLKAFTGPTVHVQASGANKPRLFTGDVAGVDAPRFLIMPVRLAS